MKWSTTNSKEVKVINARSETSDLYFKNFKKCVIIIQGYYEWKVTTSASGKDIKQPYFFRSANKEQEYLLLAGLYKDKYDSKGFEYKEFLVLTQEANKQIASIHDRMPVILSDEIME